MSNLVYLSLIAGMALPAFAQREQLIGTWTSAGPFGEEGPPLVARAEFRDNGEFSLLFTSTLGAEEFLGGGEGEEEGEEPEDEGAALSAQIFAELLPDSLTIAMTATGTWEADGQALRLDATAGQVRLNGLEFREFLVQIAVEMARRMAEAFEVPEADYPDFEAQIVENVLSGAGAGFDEFSFDDMDLEGTYALGDDGSLLITDEEGETTTWHRSAISAVEAFSWGRLKALGPIPSAPRR
jgi:hypothetical protein